ncbi:MAG: dienelactone hydrolase family protein [Candidatus Korobacteraceae bacterium]
MMHSLRIALAAFALLGVAAAQDWAKEAVEKSPRHQEWVQIKHGGRTVDAFVVYPEVSNKATTVLVIHEIFGLSDWVRSVADQLAAKGYIAIAPDFLSGMGPGGGRTTAYPDVTAAREANSKLPTDQVMADLNAAADYALKLPAGNGKIVVAGFCWGGSRTFDFATRRADLKAAFAFYGGGPMDPGAIRAIKAPVYGFYGGNDARVNATIPKSEELMKQAGKTYQPVIYEGAGHGFLRTGQGPNPSAADKKAHDEAWQRWLSLLGKL